MILLYLLIILILWRIYSFMQIEFFQKKKNKNAKRKKLNFIIPIRDREKDLEQLISQLKKVLKYQKIEYKIYIIEQSFNKKLFNKGKIINAAFKESLKDNFSNIYIIHDVDNIPLTNDIINYYYDKNNVNHFYGYQGWLGGFFSITKKYFTKVNGFSNSYWGWGCEDNDIEKRINLYNIKIDRKNLIKRRSTNLIKDDVSWSDSKKIYYINKNKYNNKINPKMKNKILYRKIWSSNLKKDDIIKIISLDGLSNCKYKIKKKYFYNDDKNIIRILIDI